MFKPATLAAAALLALAAAPAQAQGLPDFTRMNLNQMNNNFNAGLNGQIAQRQQQIMASVLSNPQAIAAYRAGTCGYGLTPQQFAYKYAATAGCTPQGYANYTNTTRQIAASDARAVQQYRNWQAGPNGMGAALADRSASGDYRSRETGWLLRGCTSYVQPDGRTLRVCP